MWRGPMPRLVVMRVPGPENVLSQSSNYQGGHHSEDQNALLLVMVESGQCFLQPLVVPLELFQLMRSVCTWSSDELAPLKISLR
ncbi:hypothetical protein Syun_031668 [Stephania yunnanensis]|uniref:Uncharacterized protein n=1 Tax=Stephania yunnanensis TaxID=152371 RepID=A0AAP0E2N3_9MAGN